MKALMLGVIFASMFCVSKTNISIEPDVHITYRCNDELMFGEEKIITKVNTILCDAQSAIAYDSIECFWDNLKVSWTALPAARG